jgi:hypothetical protein
MTPVPARPTVTIATRPLWQIRLAQGLPRYLLYAVCTAGLAASARFAIAPPQPVLRAAPVSASSQPDPSAQGYAALFARRYLTWDATEPQASTRALGSFVGPGMEVGAGLRLPSSGEQHVEWIEVVQEREPEPREHVYTLAAQTDSAGLVYLTVSVVRTAEGDLALAGYPAFVGAPATSPAPAAPPSREVQDQALVTVVERALRNYLAASPQELAADLASGARVSLPALPMALESMQHLTWSPHGRSVLAVVEAEDARGAQYTLEYELDVTVAQGRWEIAAVQTDPDT